MRKGEKDKLTPFPACENVPAQSQGLPLPKIASAANCGGPCARVVQEDSSVQ